MKYLLTYCPRCRARFYVDEDEKEEGKIKAHCPYCNLRYKDIWDQSRVTDAKYKWELYRGLYERVKFSRKRGLHLKSGGLLLFSIFLLFTLSMFSVFFIDSFSTIYQGVGLGAFIFSLFVVLGAFNAYKRNSFVISLAGSIFAILGSIIWGSLSFVDDHIFFNDLFSLLYLLVCLILSFTALILIVKDREGFDFGY